MREVFGCRGGSRSYNTAQDECTAGRLREKLWTEESHAGNAKNLLSYVYASRLGTGMRRLAMATPIEAGV